MFGEVLLKAFLSNTCRSSESYRIPEKESIIKNPVAGPVEGAGVVTSIQAVLQDSPAG
jgi:hypothetical protein